MAKKLNPLIFAFALPVLGIVFLGVFALVRSVNMGDTPPFNLDAYRQNWNTLGGNEYILRGQIDRQLGQKENKGRIISVKLLDDSGRVPVFIPTSVNQNFEVNQRYNIRVRVRGDVLYVLSMDKF
jgi:hypothetical protein